MFGRRQETEVIALHPVIQAPAQALQDTSRREPRLETLPISGKAMNIEGAADTIEQIVVRVDALFNERIDRIKAPEMKRGELAGAIDSIVQELAKAGEHKLDEQECRDVVTQVLNTFSQNLNLGFPARQQTPPQGTPRTAKEKNITKSRSSVETAKQIVQPILMDRLDLSNALQLPRNELARQINEIVSEILSEEKTQLNQLEQRDLITMLMNDMLGLGPLEVLLSDESVTDIMVNGPQQVYVERKGKLEITDVEFRDNQHVMNIATRIRLNKLLCGSMLYLTTGSIESKHQK